MNISGDDSFNHNNSFNLTHPLYKGGLATQIAFAIIVVLCIVGNLLVFIVFLYARKLRRSSHGILIRNLAVVDFLTGIFTIVSPQHIIREAYPIPPPGISGKLFCMTIGSEIFTFAFGFISMYTLCVLSLERRYGVVKSQLHSIYFSMTRTKWMVVGVWIWGILLVIMNIFQSHYIIGENPPCKWRPLPGGRDLNIVVYFVLFLFRFVLPMICIIACYANIWRHTRSTIRDLQQVENKKMIASYRAKNKVTITCAITSLAFIICWLPNVIYSTLANVGVTKIGNDAHFITKLLVIFNSCMNPFIYACTNSNYRNEFIKMLKDCKCNAKNTRLVGKSKFCDRPNSYFMTSINR